MTDATNQPGQTADAAPSSTEPSTTLDAAATAAEGVVNAATAGVADITAAAHTEAQGVLASLVSKLTNFEHALAADALAELNKLKELLHL